MAKLKGADELRAYIRKYPKTAMRGAKDGMTTGAARLQRAARNNLKPWLQGGGLDRGQLRQSITTFVGYVVDGVAGYVGTNKTYAPHVEFGTRPHWPPEGALAVWAQRHGVSEYGIRAAIARRGTRARKFLGTAAEREARNVLRDIEAGIRKAIAAR